MIEIKGIELKNTLSEFTLREYEQLTSILMSKTNTIDRYIQAMVLAGMTDKDVLTSLKLSDARTFMESLEIETGLESEFHRTVSVGDKTYRICEDDEVFDEPSLTDANRIQKRIEEKGFDYIVYAMAALYKDESLGYAEHNAEAHIKHKMKLIGGLPANLFIATIPLLIKDFVSKHNDSQTNEKITQILDDESKIN